MLPTLLLLGMVLVPLPWPGRVAVIGRMHAREVDVVGVALNLTKIEWGGGEPVWVPPGTLPPVLGSGGWLLVFPDVSGDPRYECDRVGVAGIDINRDFPYGWRPLRNPETLTGPRPLSSRHAQEVWETLKAFAPRTVLSLHTGEEAVYSPWDGSWKPPPQTLDACEARDLLSWPEARCGPAGELSGYLAPGSAIDAAAGLLPSVEAALTIELGGDPQSLDCQTAFRASRGAETLVALVRWQPEPCSS